jgi:hypothetical protein
MSVHQIQLIHGERYMKTCVHCNCKIPLCVGNGLQVFSLRECRFLRLYQQHIYQVYDGAELHEIIHVQ